MCMCVCGEGEEVELLVLCSMCSCCLRVAVTLKKVAAYRGVGLVGPDLTLAG
jgi:hypothetical protein